MSKQLQYNHNDYCSVIIPLALTLIMVLTVMSHVLMYNLPTLLGKMVAHTGITQAMQKQTHVYVNLDIVNSLL